MNEGKAAGQSRKRIGTAWGQCREIGLIAFGSVGDSA